MERVTKTKLSVPAAADQWVSAREDKAAAKALEDEAAAVLVAHFEKTGRSSYKDTIGLTTPAARTVLDQAKVREFLGARLSEFQSTSHPKPTLTLLKKA